ncbi:hypothetical protein ACFTWD_04910 [Streptomyces sp. NPDC056943]|uniref:hypothetical protein n=1 Tax=Streptomyces sp. NPDC056943 TaxID=3345971 RepID=UPI00364217C8
MTELRTHIAQYRAEVARLLEVDGHREIAEAYLRAGTPALKIAQLFAPLYADLVTTE